MPLFCFLQPNGLTIGVKHSYNGKIREPFICVKHLLAYFQTCGCIKMCFYRIIYSLITHAPNLDLSNRGFPYISAQNLIKLPVLKRSI